MNHSIPKTTSRLLQDYNMIQIKQQQRSILFTILALITILSTLIYTSTATDTCRYCAQLQTLSDCAECHKTCRWEIADTNHGHLAVPIGSGKQAYRYTNGKCVEAYRP